MSFNSFSYALFLPLVLLVTHVLRRRVAGRNAFLLTASYFFYGSWDWRFLSLIWISTGVDYICGRLLDWKDMDVPIPDEAWPRRKAILLISLLCNLVLLGFFKYYGFFVESAAAFLETIGFRAHLPALNIVLPVGISFYTFQTLSYTIDVYYGKLRAERNLLNFALFVAFFPQLVAGPIERARDLLPQMRMARPVALEVFYSGFYLIGWGLFKKVVIADNAAILANDVFAASSPAGLASLIGVYAFALQIYCDFSGYSDIARGTARCMGFDLMLNFNLPYFAVNPSDFWRRWHISLSTWLRDYLYIPLGGSRRGIRRTYINLMLTMVLGGLWHGAGWTFVCWGIYHGLLLCFHRVFQPGMARLAAPLEKSFPISWFAARVFLFFHLTCISWLLFRAESIGQAWSMFRAVMTDWTLGGQVGLSAMMQVGVCAAGLVCIQIAQHVKKDMDVVLHSPLPVRALLYLAGMLGFIFLGEYGGQSFIYFQF
ncbi:MAG TPA: MBOAT family O-acyltransferase [Kiritimatiellia bacterium]|nr:MBOAT family O-acyltransferase [Kiritimatiellia bacterium]